MNNRTKTMVLARLVAVLVIPGLDLQAANTIPLNLPRPDGKPGNPKKPVKVYLLAGQSNMNGMGDLTGARPPWTRVFLCADPAIIPGTMPIGGSAIARHGVFEAKATVYSGKQLVKTVPVALGTLMERLPATEGSQTVMVTAQIDVPATGTYTLRAGFEDTTHAVVTLDGKEVYRKEVGGKPVLMKVALETGRRYPITITYFKGGSAALWMEQVDLEGRGDLVTVTKKDKKFQYLLDDAGKWTVRNDVYYYDARIGFKGSPLSPTSNGNSIGPEVGFGHVMGTFHDEQVLLIKTAMGNRALGFDFRPPSSGRTQPTNQWESLEYKLMVEGVRKTLDQIAKIVPGYQGQGYEMAGFGWFQGHKDQGATKEEYEKNLVNLINDLRKEFNAPKMPAVVATVGFGGYRMADVFKPIWTAQMAVGDSKQHPEFAGTVASVDTRDFWREVEESPRSQDYHYNRNAETYLLVGEAMGRAMVRLEGDEAEAIPKSDREARVAADVAAQATKPTPTAEQKAASLAALKPMILDGALAAFVNNPRYQSGLKAAIKGEKPARVLPLLNDTLDEAADYYRAAGISDYDWKLFGGQIKDATWDYFSFDLPKAQPDPKSKVIPVAPVILPAGMENWFAPDFDAKKAGWLSGAAPFGVAKDPIDYPEWYGPSKRGPAKTVCEKDVLLMRQTFDLPPLKDGHRYRIRVNGSVHANSGEGYAIYVNGKLLAESKAGIVAWRREGWKPRGSHVWADFRDEFKGGKVTIAASNFPMNNRTGEGFLPASRDPLSVWLEEMKIPPLDYTIPANANKPTPGGDITAAPGAGAVIPRETRDISGWQAHISKKLLASEPDATARALAGLKKMLDEIVRVVPASAVTELRKVPLYVSPAYKAGRSGAEFHPDADWLRDNGRDPAMARSVEFSGVHDFEAEMRRMPNFALHELAHAYQFRALKDGFDNADIKAAYERAKAGHSYERVERSFGKGNGRPNTFERAYAMTNPMEYFAETTEAYFTRNDFFPFTHEELKRHDPAMFTLLARLWVVPDAK